jgi:hypothetical protein
VVADKKIVKIALKAPAESGEYRVEFHLRIRDVGYFGYPYTFTLLVA